MKITPQPGIVQLKLIEVSVGGLDTSSRDSAVEFAEVVALGVFPANLPTNPGLKVGDKVFVKAWAVDIISHDGQKYYFVNVNSNGILAVVK